MKRFFIVLFIVITLIGMFLLCYEFRSKQEHSISIYTLTQHEIDLIQDGDIILRHGYGMVSDLIVKTLKDDHNVSHCAIICKDSLNKITVLHSVSQSLSDFDGVQSQGLRKFINDSKQNSVIVLRYRKANLYADNQRISKSAIGFLEKRIPFDHSFSLSDTTSFYCTEFIWKVFLEAYGDDIFISSQGVRYDPMAFNAFWDTSRFEVVFSHHHKMINH